MSSPPEYITAAAIAAELDVHPQTVQSYFRSGALPGRKIGRNWTTTRAAFDHWLAGGNGGQPAPLEQQTPPPLETK